MTHKIINQYGHYIDDITLRNEIMHQVKVDNVNLFKLGDGEAEIISHKVDADGNKETLVEVSI